MANAFGNPITLTATMAATWRNTANSNAPQNQEIHVQKIIWDGATTAGHQAILQYGDGTTFWQATANATPSVPFVSDFIGGRPLNDFKLSTLGSGTVLIYY